MSYSGAGLVAPPPPPSSGQSGRDVLTIILGVLMTLFLIVSGVMTALFVMRTGELRDTRAAVSRQDRTISQKERDLQAVARDKQRLQEALSDAQTDLTGSKNQADELKRQKQVISHCLQLYAEASRATDAGDQTTAKAKAAEATPVCNEAAAYLD